ncbi:SusC/RagA family TonB-linked outer membrane protein [Pseudopedobacter beijingensis]|uniref:SusC/RagA family TonB-linked outer membrane protein n=1 Tax=Pseudopedobacter beijingensis TaxID=1207056 RepID=A0ABW4IDL4_9SPHI
MKRGLLVGIIGLFFMSLHVFAQQVNVTGRVTAADDGMPLPGVSVSVKGSKSATQTDINGNYKVSVAKDAVLVFSFMGMQTQEKTVGGATTINVVLASDAKALNEVVVTALGIERDKRTLTYSVQNVKGEDLRESNQSNIINALQGQIAGAQISSSGGSPGLPSEIILRGSTSMNGDNQPLMIVDGIRVNNSSSNGTVNRLADFNPEDIEDVSILKGAAAAALYGIDAASGAIIITTKKGKAGALQINGSYKSFVETMGRTAKQQGIYTLGTGGVFDESVASSWGRKFRYDESVYNNVDRFFQTGVTHDVNLNLNGGTEKLNYYVSGGYRNAGSMVPNTNQEKINLMLKGTAKISSKMDFTTSMSYIRNDIQEGLGGASAGGWINSISLYPLMYDILEYEKPNGEPLYTYQENDPRNARISPMWGVMRNPRVNDVERFLINGNLVYKPSNWITLNYRLGQDLTNSKYRTIVTPGTPGSADTFNGSVSESNGLTKFITSTLNTTFDRKINQDFRATLILGINSDYYDGQSVAYSAREFTADGIFSPNVADKTTYNITDSWSRRQRYAVYGDFKLEYKNIFAIGITGRNDWTSTLPKDARTFYSPSYSASFAYSELLEAKDWFGKLRFSYAKVGKDAPIYRTNTNLNQVQTVGGGYVKSALSGNPYLKPERTSETELGSEWSFFGRRLNLDVTYYNRKSIDMIMTTRVPLPSANVQMTFNIGSIENKGYEISLNGIPVKTKDFTWSATLNAWKNTSKVLEFPGDIITFPYTNAQLNGGKAASTLNKPVLGVVGYDYKKNEDGYTIIDKNGYPVIAGTKDDEKYIGNREPEFNIGLINNLKYKQFSLSFLWDFRFGGDIFNASRQRMMSVGTAYDVGQWRDKEFVFNGVVQQDDGSYVKNTKTVVLDYSFFANNYYQVGTNFIEKVNWARVRYITLGYSMPKKLSSRLGLRNIGLEFSAQNPIIITNYSGGDPEVNSAGPNAGGAGGASTMGVDNGAIPLPRTYSLGLNITL